ncbi:Tpn1p ASCRUDRAFT_74282 [Ascoidea rubescens DSM 1968]|uniref:Vitamin B6 transporter n=1 Tax=Ascoidea rubescens DSM 1968 TaxID=1344418 RepID=A0A1D2VMM6_9ASCO|nr:hypothetical protein ASCRUDRAFT_74282 [Ascoidea rubescens DSM 1968]ODV62817.1 hypothetical protein ASCRUDRAFT_74282 [Ascoidea rubescens DSM 1968]
MDLEKNNRIDVENVSSSSNVVHNIDNDKNDKIHEKSQFYQKTDNFFLFLKKVSNKLDSFGVEERGIERVQPFERTTNKRKAILQVIGLWLSAAGGLSSTSSLLLGSVVFGLGLKDSFLSGILGLTLGCAIAGYCSIMGPRSGCRQMISARLLFGWWFVKFVALFSVLGVMGWSVVNSVAGGQILTSVSDGKIPIEGGITIVAFISLIVSIYGIKQLLRVETLLAFPVLTAFLLLYVVSGPKMSYLPESHSHGDSITIKGNWLSFFALSYACTSTWGSISADYYILFPESINDVETFFITFFGILIPTSFVSCIALILSNIANAYPPWLEAYENLGMGGLLAEAYSPWGAGGKFLLMLLFLSLISNNIINTYSAAFGLQLDGGWLAKVPRFLWAIILTLIYYACAMIGRNHFATILGNFLPMIGYWISIYFILLLEENQIFRTKWFIHLYTKEFEQANSDSDNYIQSHQSELHSAKITKKQCYNWEIWNDASKMTNGFASMGAFAFGAVGAAMGMAQVYYIGPIAAKFGEYGGDLGMWLAMGFSGVTYPFFRYLELKKFGR